MWDRQGQLHLPVSPSPGIMVPEERGGSGYVAPAPFPLSTWHHPSAPASSRTSVQPGQAGRWPGPGTAQRHCGHFMGDLLGRLALFGALVLSGEWGPGVLGTELPHCWGRFWAPLMGLVQGDGGKVQAGHKCPQVCILGIARWNPTTEHSLHFCFGCATQSCVPAWAVCLSVCAVSLCLCVPACVHSDTASITMCPCIYWVCVHGSLCVCVCIPLRAQCQHVCTQVLRVPVRAGLYLYVPLSVPTSLPYAHIPPHAHHFHVSCVHAPVHHRHAVSWPAPVLSILTPPCPHQTLQKIPMLGPETPPSSPCLA